MGDEKRKYKKSKNVKPTIKLFTFIFCMYKRTFFARKYSLGKYVLYTITILVKFFLVLHDILNEIIK